MALFQKSVLNKYLKSLDVAKVDAAYNKFSAQFHNPEFQLNIRKAKEEQYQEGFLNDLFVNVLGYIKNPEPKFNLTTEFKNIKNAKKADGAILQKGKAIAVIELKGMDTPNLDKVEGQAFGYLRNQPDAVYVITANFEKLRFYIEKAHEYIEWNLFSLTKEQFKEVWLCLSKESVLSGLPKQIKEESIIEEKTITERLYKDYSTFRGELYNSISKQNPDIDPILLFKKTQKLLDRFLFIFFAEDRLLVPPNSIGRIIKRWNILKEQDFYKPLYEIFQQYFGYFNTGRKGQKSIDDIFAYNGGLFKPDTILDGLKVDDYVLFKHTQRLTKYDFISEVDVNILGHIFEHSLNDIEEINAQLEGEKLDKSKTKRKKDGVFYTPKYITKYIVENTVGKLCEEKKTELGIVDIDFSKTYMTKRKRTTKDGKKTFLSAEGEKIFNSLNQYRDYLLNLTICDPACGSGAFLNQAFNFLIEEHENIDQYHASLRGDTMTLTDVTKDILERNLFGVDINEEAVEIAKLSLWLRTAQKGRKLNNLNENIKCGNSLIDDPKVAGEKAFDWEKEFPEVFKNGGFDVVIGNPPYVRQELLKPFKPYFEKTFQTYQGTADLFIYFIEISLDRLLKENGIYSVIISNKWMRSNYGKPLRIWMKKKRIIEIIDFKGLPVFSDATTYTCILSLSKKPASNTFIATEPIDLSFIDLKHLIKNTGFKVKIDGLNNNGWALVNEKISSLIDKLKNSTITLNEYVNQKIYYGIKTGLNEAFVINENQKKLLIGKDPNCSEIIKPFLAGKDIKRYSVNFNNTYLILLPSGWTNKNKGEEDGWSFFNKTFPSISNYLLKHETKAKKRYDKGDYWWELRPCEYYEEFEKTKILWPGISNLAATFAIDEKSHYGNDNNQLIINSSKKLLGILNSKVSKFFLSNKCDRVQGGFYRLKMIYIQEIPIPKIEFEKKNDIETLVSNQINDTNSLFNLKKTFLRLILRRFSLEKLSKKLQNWHTLTFADFVKELKKKKIKLGLAEEAEWEEYFEAEKTKAQEIQAVIDKTDREIDQMVYGLYGLTEEEIGIVENS